jgi:hypothetical protein
MSALGFRGDDYRGAACVNGNRNLKLSAQRLENRKNPVQFLRSSSLRGSRPGGFAPNVEKVGPGTLHGESVLNRRFQMEKLVAIGKTIRRDVQHAHHQRALPENQFPRDELHLEFSSRHHLVKALELRRLSTRL